MNLVNGNFYLYFLFWYSNTNKFKRKIVRKGQIKWFLFAKNDP